MSAAIIYLTFERSFDHFGLMRWTNENFSAKTSVLMNN